MISVVVEEGWQEGWSGKMKGKRLGVGVYNLSLCGSLCGGNQPERSHDGIRLHEARARPLLTSLFS